MNIYQIYYDEATRQKLDPGFIPMNNSRNERSDWREYWPIRHFLLNETLKNDEFYGFFSPKFQEKTNLTSKDVEFVVNSQNVDIVSFSPFFDQMSYFINPFIQGDITHPGLLASAQSFIDSQNISIPLNKLVCDCTNTIFCNFFVAKGHFWKRWIHYCELVFDLCENHPNNPLAQQLNSIVPYKKDEVVAMKVFLIERMVTFLLVTENFSKGSCNVITLPYAGQLLLSQQKKMIQCDALKQAFIRTQNPFFLDCFYENVTEVGLAIKDQIELNQQISNQQ